MTKVAYTPEAAKILLKLERQTARRIREYMDEVGRLDDPRSRGKALVGNLGGLWRYRIGDWRVMSVISDGEADEEPKQIVITVLVVDIGHRKEVYR